MTKARALGIVGTFLLSLACAACGGDDSEGGGATAGHPAAEDTGGFGFEAPAKAIVRRTAGGHIDVRVSGASNVTYEIEGLPAGIEKKEHSDSVIALVFGAGEPELGEHPIRVRAKSGDVVREQAITLIVADDPGILDTTFADKGLAAGIVSNIATGIAVDAKGRVVVAGQEMTGKKLFASRYLANGDLDRDFDGDGVAYTAFDAALPMNYASSIATGVDGSIFIGGLGASDLAHGTPCIVKLDEKGAPASGFGNAGVACISDGALNGFSEILTLHLLPGGSILAGGFTGGFDNGDPIVMKLSPNGALDGSFGIGGIARITTGENDLGERIAVDSKGRIVLVGTATEASASNMIVVRLSSAGKLDPWFGAGGVLKVARNATYSGAHGVAIGANDEVFVSGSEDKKGIILGLEPAKGEPLGSFGTNGAVLFASGLSANVRSLTWDEGKLVGVGGWMTDVVSTPMAVRLSPDGSPDASFGNAGTMTLPNGSIARSVSVDASSRAVVLLEGESGYVVARAWR